MLPQLPIQRFPVGLLDLLGLKALGQTPIKLAETVGITLADGVDYYLAQRRTVVSGTTAIAMTGNGNFIAVGVVVPSSEIWFVYNVTARLASPTAAATALRYWATVTKSIAGTFPLALTESVSVGAGDNAAVSTQFERPAIFLPGDQFGFSTGAATGVPASNGVIILDVARLVL